MTELPRIQRRELAALVDDLSELSTQQWRSTTLQQTLERFRQVGPIALPVKSSPAGLGELIVHAEDIRRPLGLRHDPDAAGLLAVARFFATKDFAVNSKTLVKAWRCERPMRTSRQGPAPRSVARCWPWSWRWQAAARSCPTSAVKEPQS